MIIKNHEVAEFGNFLLELKLKGHSSNMRVRLVRLLDERLALINEEREALFEDYVMKDENGNPIKELDEETGKEIFPLENGNEYQKELQKLLLEDFIIEENEARSLMLSEVRSAVLNCEIEFSGKEAMQYDRWCEIVEVDG